MTEPTPIRQPQSQPKQQPQVNIATLAEQIGHMTITANVLGQQGNVAGHNAARRAADAYLDLALVLLGVEPSEK